MCGEKNSGSCEEKTERGSPPHVRGKEKVLQDLANAIRITPACAGKSSDSVGSEAFTEDHPRMCGEKLNTKRKGR